MIVLTIRIIYINLELKENVEKKSQDFFGEMDFGHFKNVYNINPKRVFGKRWFVTINENYGKMPKIKIYFLKR